MKLYVDRFIRRSATSNPYQSNSRLIRDLYSWDRPLGLHANPAGRIVFDMGDTSVTTEAEIWSRAIRPEVGDLSTEAAREWLRLQLSEADTERVIYE
jgi:hypothetical protein